MSTAPTAPYAKFTAHYVLDTAAIVTTAFWWTFYELFNKAKFIDYIYRHLTITALTSVLYLRILKTIIDW